MRPTDPFSKYSSKIKRISIELPNYKFFHSPSQLDKNDNRFLGRTKIIEQLKSILTKNEPNSGAYLVTGYRGMGKSSYVNKVLNEITLKKKNTISRLVRYSLFFFIVYLNLSFFIIDEKISENILKLISVITTFLLVVFFENWLFNNTLIHLIIDFKKPNKQRVDSEDKTKTVEKKSPWKEKIYASLPLLYLTYFLVYYFVYFFYNHSTSFAIIFAVHLTITIFIFDLWFFDNSTIRLIGYLIRAKLIQIFRGEWKELGHYIESKFVKIKHSLVNIRPIVLERINKRRRVVLNLNLGHEILNEKDIISLIAKNVEKRFQKFAFSLRRQFLFYGLKFALLFFLASQITDSKPLQPVDNKTSFYEILLPTQRSDFKNITNCCKSEYWGMVRDTINNKANILALLEGHSEKAVSSKTFSVKISGDKVNDSIRTDSTKTQSSVIRSFFTRPFLLLIRGINLVDIYCDWAYNYLSNKIIKLLSFDLPIPRHLNYLFLFTFFLLNFVLMFLLQCFFRTGYTELTSRKIIIRKLKLLNEHIDAAIRTEAASGFTVNEAKIGFNVNQRKAKEYPLASVRQIEKGLIDIFEDINHLSFPILRPEFIIVFDELDKIDPQSNTNIDNKEEESTDFDNSINGFTGGTATRVRKQNVLKLLANLKYLITTAKAKFIFISGRELYDAFLADVSDRQFSISSIFHKVIYVESFLSEASDHNTSDITSMTEHYVCQFLMPEWFIVYMTHKEGSRNNALTLKCYEKYLSREFNKQKDDAETKKAIMQLYQFIYYLTHVSNGAPKKITDLFERHLVPYNSCNGDSDLFIGKRNNGFYLSFGFYDQCKIGFIHYLAHPIIKAIVNNVGSYGDKLLVSASFLIDHIYKFHGNGFSWRNLEHAPEILDINHTPELRNFIGIIVNYLTQTHINSVISGLYLFKFPMKISEEISFISKMSEEASAIFNFTLDESLSVKRYYSKLLQRSIKQYNAEGQHKLKDGEFIHAIADIHHILGDLHLLDEEYTEAIFEFQSCIQYVSRDFRGSYDSHQVTHLLFIVRTMLKLGLVFEKRKTYDSAYLTYCELVSMSIDFRFVDEKQLGMKYKIEKKDDWTRQRAVFYKSHKIDWWNDEDVFVNETKPEILNEDEKKDIYYSANGDELISSLAKITTPLKNKIITRLSLFEDSRLMFQALLAKLFVLEKHQLGGISLSNLEVTEGEFLNLHLATNIKEKFLISADFFKKLGDIMYYKNGLINNESSTLFNGLYFWDYDITENIDSYCENVVQKESLKYIRKIPFSDLRFQDMKKYENTIVGKTEEKKNSPKKLSDQIREYIKQCDLKWLQTIDADILEKDKNEIVKFFNSKHSYVKGINRAILIKVESCNKRRKELLEDRNIAPCHACKYYNRSLKILAENLLKKKLEETTESKAFLFLRALDEPELFYSYRNNFTQILASTLGSFGDVLISCATNEDHIYPDFLLGFFKYIRDTSVEGIERFENEVREKKDEKEKKEAKFVKYFDEFNDIEDALSDNFLFKKLAIKYYEDYKDQIKNPKFIDHIEKDELDRNRQLINYLNKHSDTKAEVKDFLVEKIEKNKSENKYISDILQETWHQGLSNLEKALLYYLAAAKYYKRSLNLKETHAMYRKILQLLIHCAGSSPFHKKWIKKYVEDGSVKNEIVRRIIQSIYAAYEQIHVAEIQKLKWNNTQELYEMLDLTQLSLFPDLEETIYAYYELQIVCGYSVINKKDRKENEISVEQLYNLQSLSPCRLNSTIYNRLIGLRFKTLLNRKLLEYMLCVETVTKGKSEETIFEQRYSFETCTYKPEHAISFYQVLQNKLDNKSGKNLRKDSFLIKSLENENDDIDKFLDAIEFLIVDSIFCLQKFIEVLYPGNKTLLFTNSYTADIYKQLFEWTQLFDYLFMLYAYMDDSYPKGKKDNDKKKKDIRDKLVSHCLRRFEVKKKKDERSDAEIRKNKVIKLRVERWLNCIFSFDCPVKKLQLIFVNKSRVYSAVRFIDSKVSFKGRAEKLFENLKKQIDTSNTHIIDCNYLAEMGIKKYHSAFAAHQEGKSYKSMIEDMYYLNDDLDNDSLKFYLALERYHINVKDVYENIRKLKDVYENSQLFDVNKYINEEK